MKKGTTHLFKLISVLCVMTLLFVGCGEKKVEPVVDKTQATPQVRPVTTAQESYIGEAEAKIMMTKCELTKFNQAFYHLQDGKTYFVSPVNRIKSLEELTKYYGDAIKLPQEKNGYTFQECFFSAKEKYERVVEVTPTETLYDTPFEIESFNIDDVSSYSVIYNDKTTKDSVWLSVSLEMSAAEYIELSQENAEITPIVGYNDFFVARSNGKCNYILYDDKENNCSISMTATGTLSGNPLTEETLIERVEQFKAGLGV